MTTDRPLRGIMGLLPICLLGGCVGSLLSGGKPDNLYRFGVSDSAATVRATPISAQAIVLERIHFASEVDGDRILAVHDGRALYIKGSRWITAGPSLFTQAMLRNFQLHANGFRLTPHQDGGSTGYSLAISIARFEAHYDEVAMVQPPTIIVEGDATLSDIAGRKPFAISHFLTPIRAQGNRAMDIVLAFDRATAGFTEDISEWVGASAASHALLTGPTGQVCSDRGSFLPNTAGHLPPQSAPACPPQR